MTTILSVWVAGLKDSTFNLVWRMAPGECRAQAAGLVPQGWACSSSKSQMQVHLGPVIWALVDWHPLLKQVIGNIY